MEYQSLSQLLLFYRNTNYRHAFKVVILCPGWFDTPLTTNPKATRIHPAYKDNPALPCNQFRASKGPVLGDTSKLVQRVWEISNREEVPLRVPLGLDAIAGFESQLESMKKDLEAARHWSADLAFDSDSS